MKAGLATIALRQYDVFQAIDMAADAGYHGVEIWGRAPHTPDEFDADHTRRIRARAHDRGLKVSMFGSYVNPSAPDYDQKSVDALKIAALLETRLIRIWAGGREPHQADEDLWRHVSRSLHEYALLAEDEGITLAIEMHGGTLCSTVEGCKRVIEEAAAPNLKLNYQVYDSANPDMDRTIAMLGDHVVNVHAQNQRVSPVDGKLELSLIEEGLVDYDRALSLLADHGFNGYVEVEFLKDDSLSEEALLDSLQKDAAYLRKITAAHGSCAC